MGDEYIIILQNIIGDNFFKCKEQIDIEQLFIEHNNR